ncbi:MAG TPA: NAD-dependent epimerase/dehydratase family protein [Zeimonas sp.]|nr:NAD-dependent epimerase/dehydratase family protein [Zeimonas sp.]
MNTASRTVLVLGANGRFGAVATRAFTDAGWQVLAQARRAPAALPAGARHLATSIEQTEALAREARGAAVVVHAANPVYTRWTREAVPLARAGMDVAARLGATFMLPGNVYNFGASMPALLDEDTPQRPSSRKGRIRATIEAELQARAADGLRGVVIRAGDFFGAGTGSWFDQVIVRSLRSGTLVYPGPLDVAHAWAYLPDLARAFVAVAELDDLPAFTRLHFAGHSPTGAEMLSAIERAAGSLDLRPASGWRHTRVPWSLLRAAGLVVPMWREIAEMAYLWRIPHALDGAALQRLTGPLPQTPLESAVAFALRDLGLRGHGAPEAVRLRRYGYLRSSHHQAADDLGR